MHTSIKTLALLFSLAVLLFIVYAYYDGYGMTDESGDAEISQGAGVVSLPPVPRDGNTSLEEVLWQRKSVRQYKDEPLPLADLSFLLWAAQGVNRPASLVGHAGRTAPSAGATYPLQLYVLAGDVEGLQPGVYRYDSNAHALRKTKDGDLRSELASAALGQSMPADAPATIAIAADYERTTGRYGERGIRYVDMEAGHAGQDIYLAAAARDLGTVAVGAFDDQRINKILGIPEAQTTTYLFPIGAV